MYTRAGFDCVYPVLGHQGQIRDPAGVVSAQFTSRDSGRGGVTLGAEDPKVYCICTR